MNVSDRLIRNTLDKYKLDDLYESMRDLYNIAHKQGQLQMKVRAASACLTGVIVEASLYENSIISKCSRTIVAHH